MAQAFALSPDYTVDLTKRLVHRDASVLILDKPAGLPVHPGPKGGPSLTRFLDQLRFGLPRRPELAHRLDKETSGCLVLGRHPRAIQRLNQIFAAGLAQKTYLAITLGIPSQLEGRIDLAMSKRSPDRGWWMKPDPEGQPAATLFTVLGHTTDHALLELKPLTGRTHQLRVHCAASGFPIVGDDVYGGAPRFTGPGLMLHAWRIELPYDPKKPMIEAVAKTPKAFRAFAREVGLTLPRDENGTAED